MKQKYDAVLKRFKKIIAEEELEHRSYNSGQLVKGFITFISEWKLEFMEFRSETKHKYRFHLMDENEELVTRWDTAPHFPDLENAPFHRHTGESVEATSEFGGNELLEKACYLVLEEL